MNCIYTIFIIFATQCLSHVITGSQVPRIRGIPITKNALYSPNKDFQCLDGSLIIPFEYVNDDYCDCGDGSDEPGTPACSNGSFYCQNIGHQAVYIPSSRVNDGICDCCDASDEYSLGKNNCVDNCHELGREARLEAQKAAELAREGNKIRLEMIAKGKQLKNENQMKLAKLRTDFEEAELTRKEKEVIKNQVEERENVALEKYKPVQVESGDAKGDEEEEEEELNESEAEDYFKLLDSDNSGTITISELQVRVTFDKDRNGEVSEEEALSFLNNLREVTLQEFVTEAWPNIKPFVMLEQGIFKPTDHIDPEDDHMDDSAEHEEDLEGEQDDHVEEHEEKAEEPQIQYDEETQALVDEATNARAKFQEAEKAVLDLQSEIRKVEEKIERDYGLEEVFASMDGECFEYSDLEYVYSLCMFGKATQKSKSGGSEVTLGYYHEWSGPEGNKYSQMKYDRGLTCWNGPARTVVVNLSCGKVNQLNSVSEPSRCEYAVEFSTPALCNPSAGNTSDQHDEL